MEIIVSVMLSIVQSILFYGRTLGISVLIFAIIINLAIGYILYKKKKIKNKKGILLIIPNLLLSSTYLIFANKTFYVANIIILIILNSMMWVITTNEKNYLKNQFLDSLKLLKNTISGYKIAIMYTYEKSEENIKQNSNVNKESVKKFTISTIIVVLVVGIIIALLASADSIFANLFSGITEWISHIKMINVFDLLLRIIIMIVAYFWFLSLIIELRKKHKKEKKLNEIEVKKANSQATFTIKLLLIVLNIVYIVFCFIQISSLFAKINLNKDFDYANYARTGFFQLMYVSLINFVIILISNKFNTENEKSIKILNLTIVIYTIIIAISSIYRMHMYEMKYGLTYLRIFVYIILTTEIICFIPVTIYIFNKKIDFIKGCFAIVLTSYCIINCINLERIIVSNNLNRETDGVPIDYSYINKIASEDSYDIIEDNVNKYNATNYDINSGKPILYKILINSKELSWQEFNISKWKIRSRGINVEELFGNDENILIVKKKES